jgi:hypothetical protein
MALSPHWFRVSIDIDASGNPKGCSYEARMADRIVAIHVLPEPGPFEAPVHLLEELLTDLQERYGIQLLIF